MAWLPGATRAVMREGALNEDFRDVLRELAAAGAEFVVVGAYAMAAHGVPRATGDIDLLVRPTLSNAQRVFQALVRFGAPVAAHGLTVADLAAPGAVYQLGLPPRRIDILTQISGVDFDEAWRSRITVELEGLDVPVIGHAALAKNKRAAGRDKDLLDLKLLGAARGDVDPL